eukprot:TRINITY_DN29411_c0_g1_i1.p1 TRINITY_DN29411_c0_g1~~TRINITY_DN29411_c0_g1_i1.p1  ORF type:complete len:137 (+),score=11.94 TRINITY_DN29411_c0_g1_i1:230-640(+)
MGPTTTTWHATIDASCNRKAESQRRSELTFDSNSRCVSSFDEGDVVGVRVDCEQRSVLFFRNGVQCVPGYTADVAPPLAFAVDIFACLHMRAPGEKGGARIITPRACAMHTCAAYARRACPHPSVCTLCSGVSITF